jgi:hypothetical protein
MDPTIVLAKTDKGIEELRDRRYGLPQRLRSVLVVVDGRQSVGALLGRFGEVSGVRVALARLLDQGFVAVSNPNAVAGVADGGRTSRRAPRPAGFPRGGTFAGIRRRPAGNSRLSNHLVQAVATLREDHGGTVVLEGALDDFARVNARPA